MRVLLNIGLESKTLGKIPAPWAIDAARLAWLTVVASKVVQSDTEPTLVLEVDYDGMLTGLGGRLQNLCDTLGQDCIALWMPERNRGELVGPRAAEWGPFNPEFFFLLDGTRLQAPAAKAA